jgi:hypothetical protein
MALSGCQITNTGTQSTGSIGWSICMIGNVQNQVSVAAYGLYALVGISKAIHSGSTSRHSEGAGQDMVVGSGELWVSYRQFWLLGDGADTRPLAEPGPRSFVEVRSDAAMVSTGTSMGTIAVTVAQLDEPPTDVDASVDWEDVVEFSFGSAAGRPLLLVGLESDPEPGVPDVSIDDSEDPLRVRILAVGRDLDPDDPPERVERYLVQSWKAPLAAAVTLRERSERAATGIWVVPEPDSANLVNEDQWIRNQPLTMPPQWVPAPHPTELTGRNQPEDVLPWPAPDPAE